MPLVSAAPGGGGPIHGANCDGRTRMPTLNVLDVASFLNEFAAGCP
jgi:hypothetical protein